MTAERPKFGAVEIPWPTEVTPDDLANIDTYRLTGKSLAAAVALVMIDQARQLNLQLQNQPSSFPVLPEDPTYKEAVERSKMIPKIIIANTASKLFDIPQSIKGYITSAVIVLETEQADESVREEIYSQVLSQVFGESDSVFGVSSKNRGSQVEQLELDSIVRDAEWVLKRSQYAIILNEEGPLGLVDFYISEREKWTKEHLRSTRPSVVEGLRAGRSRFHQLYQSAEA